MFDLVPQLLSRISQVVLCLQTKPELSRDTEEASEPKCRIGVVAFFTFVLA
ncbi:MAG: hypothetical protein QGG45_22685 [Alphaproteobacteria bacterium]|nr:hypothetical protein [Alphaproteobacteria bacterium]